MNLRQLRDTRKLKSWLKAGKTVELRERSSLLGHIVPESRIRRSNEWPNFEGDAREVFGDQILPGTDLLIKERERNRY
jgi:hypothetical protein